MSNTVGIDFDGDLAEMVADFPGSLTWGGTAYACVLEPVSAGTEVEMGGYMARVNFNALVRTSLFASTRPSAGSQVTVGGTVYRVLRADTGQDDEVLLLQIGNLTG